MVILSTRWYKFQEFPFFFNRSSLRQLNSSINMHAQNWKCPTKPTWSDKKSHFTVFSLNSVKHRKHYRCAVQGTKPRRGRSSNFPFSRGVSVGEWFWNDRKEALSAYLCLTTWCVFALNPGDADTCHQITPLQCGLIKVLAQLRRFNIVFFFFFSHSNLFIKN